MVIGKVIVGLIAVVMIGYLLLNLPGLLWLG
jgi:Flp pilus assembly pilin Flp